MAAFVYDTNDSNNFSRTVDASGNALGVNTDVTISTLAAAGANSNSADQTNAGGSGLTLVIDITAISGAAATLVVTIQGKDVASGKYYTILASASLTATSTTVLQVYPGNTAVANVAVNSKLPRTWRASYTITGTTPSITATIGACVTY